MRNFKRHKKEKIMVSFKDFARLLKKTLVVVVFVLGVSGIFQKSFGDIPVYSETLMKAEAQSLQNSALFKAARENFLAAEDQAKASEAALYPRLTLDGNYFYQTNVPQIYLGPIGSGPALGPISFGANNNYSIGPTLSYTAFENGHSRGLWKSGKFLAQMRSEDAKTTKKQILLNTRLAYFKVQLSLRNLALTVHSLKLSQAREQDIRNRYRAGASSRLDAIHAKREVLNYQLKLRRTQNDLSSAMRDLLALTADPQDFQFIRPWPQELAQQLPEGVAEPSLYVRVETLDASLKAQPEKLRESASEHPQIKSLDYAAQASRNAADAQSALLWPKIQFSARAEYLYPNGPILQTVQQNILSVNLSMPIFEGSC